jgi:hypothetical protein
LTLKIGVTREKLMNRLQLVAGLFLALLPTLVTGEESAKAPYVPGLGEFMTLTQLRHAKLWFAGKAMNWDLAAYEIDELKEGLEDATKLYATHDGLPIGEMIKANITAPLDELAKAVAAKNAGKFNAGFDALTAACNTCHAGANHAFIKIQRPTAPPVTNQKFGPK